MATAMLGPQPERWQSQLLAREMMNPSAVCREIVEAFVRQRFNLLSEIVSEILPADTPPHCCHFVTLSIVAQFVYFRAGRDVIQMLLGADEVAEHHRTEDLVEHITNVSFAILGLGPPVGELYVSSSMVEARVRDEKGMSRDETNPAVTKA
jgi:hypothetical protein